MALRRKLSKLILLLSLPAIMWLYYNQVANWHYHILGNGIVVEHAHPFSNKTASGTPFQQHNHSELEYFFLAQLSNILTLVVVVLGIAAFTVNIMPRPVKRPVLVSLVSPYPCWKPLRGPPSFS